MSEEPFDLMGYVEEETESGGGGGLITEVQIDGVWMVFHKGHRSEETSWVFNSKEDGAERKTLALEYIEENSVLNSKGKVARPFVGFRITQYADSVLNREEPLNWSDGKISKQFVGFSKAYQEVLKPSIAEYVGPDKQFGFGEKFWAQVSFTADPENPTYTDRTTLEEKPNLVPYIAYAFADRAEALEAANSDDSFAFANVPDKPDLYPHDDWDSFSRDMIKIFAEEPNIAWKTFVDKERGITKSVVRQWRDEGAAQRAQDEDELPF